MYDIQIRPYMPSDQPYLAEIHDAARKIELSMASLDAAFLPFTVAVEREDFFAYPHIDVAVAAAEIVGFCAYSADELAWLYVSPQVLRQGIGRKLVEQALDTEPAIKTVEVLVGNEPARKLYETEGFQVREIVKGLMPGNEAFQVSVYRMGRS